MVPVGELDGFVLGTPEGEMDGPSESWWGNGSCDGAIEGLRDNPTEGPSDMKEDGVLDE